MAVSEQTPYIEYKANGTTTSFSLGFVCDSADKLVVTVNDLPTNVGDWSFSDGSVVFQYPPLSDSTVKIWRNSPLARSTTFKTYDNSLNPNSLNLDLDKIWLVMQELNVKNFISDNKLQELLGKLVDGDINGLPAEVLARIAGDESIKSLVNLEAIRAHQAESNLNVRIDNESLLVNQNILAEKQRAEAAEQSLQIQVNAVGVGNKAYKTYALMDADKTNIPAKSKVTVTNDTTESNNGDWQWDGVAFTKSAYDPLTQAKAYADAEITELGFQSIATEELSFSIISNLEKRLWIEANKQGLPTTYAAQCIYNAIQSFISSLINSSLANIGLDQVPDQTLSFTVATPAGQRLWIEADKSGLPTEWARKCIVDAINQVNTISTVLYKSEYQSKPKKITSGRNIVCWGDSMTYGVGATTHQFPTYLKKLLSDAGSIAQVFNAGVGGESSASIAARQGANPFIVNPFTIPADKTPVTITLGKVNGLDMYPLYQGNGEGDASGGGAALRRYFDGEIAGVKGRLSLVQPSAVGTVYNRMPDDYYAFTRAESGTAVNVARPAPFYLDYAKQHYGDIHIIWVGQNNGTDQDRAIADTKAIIQKMETLDKRYLVISKPVSSTEATTKAERDAVDAKFFAEFGRRFIPIRQYLIEYGLQDAGITPTAQDNIDIANGQVPQSLRVDTVHFTTPAYISTAQQIFNRLNELGWI